MTSPATSVAYHNLQQIYIALEKFAANRNGTLPNMASLSTLSTELEPFLFVYKKASGSKAALGGIDFMKTHNGTAFLCNATLKGRQLNEIKRETDVILFYEE